MQLSVHLINTLIHYSCPCNKDYVDEHGAVSYIRQGILEENKGMGGNKYRLTKLGEIWLEKILDVPMPVKVVSYK